MNMLKSAAILALVCLFLIGFGFAIVVGLVRPTLGVLSGVGLFLGLFLMVWFDPTAEKGRHRK